MTPDQITKDLAAHETARMAAHPKLKPTYRARPSKATMLDVVLVALMAASWMAILLGFYLLSK